MKGQTCFDREILQHGFQQLQQDFFEWLNVKSIKDYGQRFNDRL